MQGGLIQKMDVFDRKIENMTVAIFGSNNSSTGLNYLSTPNLNLSQLTIVWAVNDGETGFPVGFPIEMTSYKSNPPTLQFWAQKN